MSCFAEQGPDDGVKPCERQAREVSGSIAGENALAVRVFFSLGVHVVKIKFALVSLQNMSAREYCV